MFQREINTHCLQIAVGETETAIEAAWIWIERNMIPELDTINDPFEKEQWVAQKISMIVTAIGKLEKEKEKKKLYTFPTYMSFRYFSTSIFFLLTVYIQNRAFSFKEKNN